MNLAKKAPGSIDCQYVAGNNITSASTGLVRSEFTFNKVFNNDNGTYLPAGTQDYLAVFFCPQLSAINGGPTFGNAQLGGLSYS